MKKKAGRKGTDMQAALARVTTATIRQPSAGRGRVARRSALESLLNIKVITAKQKWAGDRFRRGWYATLGESHGIGAMDLGGRVGGSSGVSVTFAFRHAQALEGEGRDYHEACRVIDAYDVASVDRHGQPKEPAPKGLTRSILVKVCCEELSCGLIDRDAGKRHGWAARILKDGLAIYCDLFGHLFKSEVSPWFR